ncbi:MAG: hypothetical protein ABIE92_14510 [bacterium]
MNKQLIIGFSISTLLLFVLAALPYWSAEADTNDETPGLIAMIDSGDLDPMFASAGEQQESSGYDLDGIYTELKQLAKDYKRAKDRDAKERIHVRTKELMGQLFDAKVQMERRRIEAAEERLQQEKRKLENMQTHKLDMVHQASQRALDNGEVPQWAPKNQAGMD